MTRFNLLTPKASPAMVRLHLHRCEACGRPTAAPNEPMPCGHDHRYCARCQERLRAIAEDRATRILAQLFSGLFSPDAEVDPEMSAPLRPGETIH